MNSIWIINNFLHSCKYSRRGEYKQEYTSAGSYTTKSIGHITFREHNTCVCTDISVNVIIIKYILYINININIIFKVHHVPRHTRASLPHAALRYNNTMSKTTGSKINVHGRRFSHSLFIVLHPLPLSMLHLSLLSSDGH